VETNVNWGWLGGNEASAREREVPQGGSTYMRLTQHLAVSSSKAAWPVALTVFTSPQVFPSIPPFSRPC